MPMPSVIARTASEAWRDEAIPCKNYPKQPCANLNQSAALLRSS